MRSALPALACLCQLACSASIVAEPASVPSSGYLPVLLDVPVEASAVTSVTIGGVAAYGLEPASDGRLAVMTQGAPDAGPATIVVHTADTSFETHGAIEFLPSADALFDRFLAVGASLTQGVQAGVPSAHGALASPSRLISVQAGAYHPLPLLVDPLFPQIEPADIGPAPDCEVPNVVDHVASAAIEVLGYMEDPETELLGFYLVREDPDMLPFNLAVGGSDVEALVDGPDPADFAGQFLAHLSLDPYGGVTDAVPESQVDIAERLDPTLIICTETYGNDLIGAVVEGSFVDPDRLTPLDEIRGHMKRLVDRLAATDAVVFLANMPRPTLLPVTAEKRRAFIADAVARAEANGTDTDAAEATATLDIDARIAVVEQAWLDYNAALDELTAPHANVHVVDFATAVAEIEATPLTIDGTVVTVQKFGGLLSVDGVHFSDTGYAVLANLFLDAIAVETGVDIPRIDLGPVLAADPHGASALRAGGVEPNECTR
jgi:lysophospholipase L1-like esterase